MRTKKTINGQTCRAWIDRKPITRHSSGYHIYLGVKGVVGITKVMLLLEVSLYFFFRNAKTKNRPYM